MTEKKKMNNKGFSLIELIIVIAIMAILGGGLALQYMKYLSNSKVSTDINNAQEIATAINVAIADGKTVAASITGAGGTTVANVENLTALPNAAYDSSFSWAITVDASKGVTAITLNSKAIYPDAKVAGGYYATYYK